MDTNLPFRLLNKWHDTELQMGGGARAVTKIRYTLGNYGPFEAVFEREPDMDQMERAVRSKRDDLERLARL